MNTLKEDFDAPLSRVERRWIRWPAIIFTAPVVLVAAFILGALEASWDIWKDIVKCWIGKQTGD